MFRDDGAIPSQALWRTACRQARLKTKQSQKMLGGLGLGGGVEVVLQAQACRM